MAEKVVWTLITTPTGWVFRDNLPLESSISFCVEGKVVKELKIKDLLNYNEKGTQRVSQNKR